MTSDTKKREEFSYQAEMTQLLDLIINSLYQNREIFLRELISNASDALNKARFRSASGAPTLNPEAELGIELALDEGANTLTISDTGIGLTREELIDNLGTIARSGTKGFLKKLESEDASRSELIGQFGVGFYSAFMVADKVTVETRSADPEATSWIWSSTGGNSFTLEEGERDQRGTTITLHLREENAEYTKRYRVEQIVKSYSSYVSYPIRIGEDQLNETNAIWMRSRSDIEEQEYKDFYKHISSNFDEPLATIHVAVDSPIQYNALLFIPSVANHDELFQQEQRKLKLYSRKVFVRDDETGLLPSYLRFVCGVVDSEDLHLNVSREVVQANPVLTKISKALTAKVLSKLESLAKKDEETYGKFWEQFSRVFKEGVHSDFERRDRLVELLRYESTKTEPEQLAPLSSYVERMPEKQTEIYYLSAEKRDAALQNPKLEIFDKHGLEVLLFLDPIDEFIMSSLPNYKDKKLVELDHADLSWLEDAESEQQESATQSQIDALIARVTESLGGRVSEVSSSTRLVASPCALVSPKDGMTQHMERMMKVMNKGFESTPKNLELNPKNAIIRELARLSEDGESEQLELVDTCAAQLLDNVMLLEGCLARPQDMVNRNHDLMSHALSLPLPVREQRSVAPATEAADETAPITEAAAETAPITEAAAETAPTAEAAAETAPAGEAATDAGATGDSAD